MGGGTRKGNRFLVSLFGGVMNYLTTIQRLSGLAAVIFLLSAGPVWAQAGGHASVGLGHGEEGYLHLEEMIKHLEYVQSRLAI